jgi:hypothetical protein
MMGRLQIFLGIFLALSVATARAHPCRDDAVNLCGATILDLIDHTRIIACLKANMARLAPACRRTLETHDKN